jgi:hypothetical protein
MVRTEVSGDGGLEVELRADVVNGVDVEDVLVRATDVVVDEIKEATEIGVDVEGPP